VPSFEPANDRKEIDRYRSTATATHPSINCNEAKVKWRRRGGAMAEYRHRTAADIDSGPLCVKYVPLDDGTGVSAPKRGMSGPVMLFMGR